MAEALQLAGRSRHNRKAPLCGLLIAVLLAWLPSTPWADVVEEVVVVGKRPGPPLWEVAHGPHRLFILGSLTPLPVSFEWDTSRVDWVLSKATGFIEAPTIRARTANPLRLPGLMRDLGRLRKLPPGQTLADVLPAPIHARVLGELKRHGPRKQKILRLRPTFAAEALHVLAFDSAGMTADSPIPDYLRKMARRHGLTVTETSVDVGIDEALQMLSQITLADEVACMDVVLQSIGPDLAASRARAVAWIEGSVALLRQQDYPDTEAACTRGIFNGPEARKARAVARQKWLEAAEQALHTQASTVAVLPIRELFSPDGLLAVLKARGYSMGGLAASN